VIGVVLHATERRAVEELFELFKTPWEPYRAGRSYDVVLAATSEVPDGDAPLIVIYGSGPTDADRRLGISTGEGREGGTVRDEELEVPVYGRLLTFPAGDRGTPCLTTDWGAAGLTIADPEHTVIRVGYDLFAEAGRLLTAGQPPELAHVPTLDLHVELLRRWIVEAGVALLELPPVPAGHRFAVCLTHDIDFVGIRRHRFDHTMWGFLYRATVGALRRFRRGRLSLGLLLRSWKAAASLPFVYVGLAKDFWEPFGWYLRVEQGLPATYFLIPFPGRVGEHVEVQHASRRAAAYDLAELSSATAALQAAGCELGVHGIDAWHSADRGREELARIAAVTGESRIGIRVHWLLRGDDTVRALEDAGFAYDSTVGYNETVGFRGGTTQVFRPSGADVLLELPLHIQDGALFYGERLDLTEEQAWQRCGAIVDHARSSGGVVTLLWHDRSHGPERFWGDFYARLVGALRADECWFGSGAQVVEWFRKRRAARFEEVQLADGSATTTVRYDGETIEPPLTLRLHRPAAGGGAADAAWNGASGEEAQRLLQGLRRAAPAAAEPSA
jgi:hypothetical protein